MSENSNEKIESIDFSSIKRESMLAKLKSEEFDLLVIGGGVTGAGIARDATARGLSVALVDKNDFAFGTSSRSSKMAHGGFRYLKSMEFKLVKESEAERNWLRGALPHLVRPLMMFVPSFDGDTLTMGSLKLGIFFYNYLDKGKNYKKHFAIKDPAKIGSIEPTLELKGLQGSVVLYDTNVDDARLTIETVKEAVLTGRCVALNYVKVDKLEHDATGKCSGALVVDQEAKGDPFLVKAKIVVNATGIWTDEVMQKKPAGYPDKVIRPTKGVHIAFKHEDIPINNAFGINSKIDGRFFFVLRRENYVLIGTTDTDFKENPDEPVCTEKDAEYLLTTVRLRFPNANVSYDRMLGCYAGVRPLAVKKAKEGEESESAVSRDHEIIRADDDLVSICGGKLTTFRAMAEDLMLKEVLPLAKVKIPGKTFDGKKNIVRKNYLIGMKRDEWDASDIVKEFKEKKLLDDEQLSNIFKEYGRGGMVVLQYAKDDKKMLERVVPDEDTRYAPWIMAEIKYTILHDAPVHLVDILARRLEFQWTVHPSKQPAAARKVAALASAMLGWNSARSSDEVKQYLAYEKKNAFFYSKPLE
nr:glycerol-3-phosphate dehydrogenase/oxidase [Candidatus Sigynarchaeota archaeon]